jgi:uncharacterized protein with FMN-binding domain
MKRALKVAGIAAALVAIAAIAGFALLKSQARSAMAALNYAQVSMADARDGAYEGEVDAGLVAVRVRVAVRSGAIDSIELLRHDNGMGQRAEAILGEMKRANTWDVDAVSGATLSSEAIKSAVSLALKKSAPN